MQDLGTDLRRLGISEPDDALRIAHRVGSRSVGRLAVNPYLSMAGLLVTMADGLERESTRPPEDGNIYDAIASGKSVERVLARWARRSTRWTRTRSSVRRCPARCTRYSATTNTMSGSGSSARSPIGTSPIPRHPALTVCAAPRPVSAVEPSYSDICLSSTRVGRAPTASGGFDLMIAKLDEGDALPD